MSFYTPAPNYLLVDRICILQSLLYATSEDAGSEAFKGSTLYTAGKTPRITFRNREQSVTAEEITCGLCN